MNPGVIERFGTWENFLAALTVGFVAYAVFSSQALRPCSTCRKPSRARPSGR